MEKFKKFEIKKTVIITGGTLGGPNQETTWYGFGGSGSDYYVVHTDTIHY